MMTVPLRHVAKIIAGQAPPSESVSELNGGLPFLQGNAEFGSTHPTPRWECLDPPKRSTKGDLLISVRAPVGALNWADQTYGIGRGLAAIRPLGSVSGSFLMYALQANLHILEAAATGSTFSAVTADDLKSMPTPTPEPMEQLRIADFLDDQVARLNQSIGGQLTQRALALEHFRARLASEALLPVGAPGAARTRVKYLFQYERNGIWGSDADGGLDDIPCVRVADFDRERFAAKEAPTIRSVPRAQRLPRLLRRGDVLLEKSGGTPDKPVGCAVNYMSDQPAVCSNFVAALRPATSVMPRYAGLVMAAMYQTRRNGPFVNQTTGIQNIESGAYLAQEIWVPRERTQQEVVGRFEDDGELTQQFMRLADARIRLLKERKQALITAAVTGQFDVTTAGAVA